MKVVYNAEPLDFSERAKKLWEERGYTYISGGWDQLRPGDVVPAAEVLIVRLSRFIGKDEFQHFPNLKMLVSATTGHDHIDLNELRNRSIELVSLRGHDEFLKTIPSTAEHTWALLMALVRRIPAAHDHVMKGNWNRNLFKGYQLKGKTLGIIGYGRTGSKVAHYARSFDMMVRYYDPYIQGMHSERCSSLDEVLKISDIVSFHVHLNSETEELLNASNIEKTKAGALLINTSRGRIWNENAVVDALKNRKISGVATDVLSHELGSVKESPIWKAQNDGLNVIITPHIAGATIDAMAACEYYVAQQTIQILSS